MNGSTVPVVFNEPINGTISIAYVEDALVTTFKKWNIVIMDNLSVHKIKGIEDAIKSIRAYILYLSPYSPDFNPIKEMWSKIKTYVKK